MEDADDRLDQRFQGIDQRFAGLDGRLDRMNGLLVGLLLATIAGLMGRKAAVIGQP